MSKILGFLAAGVVIGAGSFGFLAPRIFADSNPAPQPNQAYQQMSQFMNSTQGQAMLQQHNQFMNSAQGQQMLQECNQYMQSFNQNEQSGN